VLDHVISKGATFGIFSRPRWVEGQHVRKNPVGINSSERLFACLVARTFDQMHEAVKPRGGPRLRPVKRLDIFPFLKKEPDRLLE
jgi:hypothetical protein